MLVFSTLFFSTECFDNFGLPFPWRLCHHYRWCYGSQVSALCCLCTAVMNWSLCLRSAIAQLSFLFAALGVQWSRVAMLPWAKHQHYPASSVILVTAHIDSYESMFVKVKLMASTSNRRFHILFFFDLCASQSMFFLKRSIDDPWFLSCPLGFPAQETCVNRFSFCDTIYLWPALVVWQVNFFICMPRKSLLFSHVPSFLLLMQAFFE